MKVLKDFNLLFVHGFVIYLVTRLSYGVGEMNDAYMTTWHFPITGGLIILIPFWLGYLSGRK